MLVSLGCLAVALTASGPADATRPDAPRIAYRFQTVAVKGLGWREDALKPVVQHSSVSVWTAPEDFLDRVAPAATAAGDATAEATGVGQTPVHVSTRKPRDFVTRVVRKGRDKAPRPVVERVREGLTATVVGRPLDQGVLAKIVVEDVDVRAVHRRKDAVGPALVKRAAAAERPFEAGRGGDASVTVTVTAAMDGEGEDGDAGEARADETGWRAGGPSERGDDAVEVEIPEVGRAVAAGEWLIPAGEVLVVGFGPHTVADADGGAMVRERLVVIAAEADDDAEAASASTLTARETPAPIVSDPVVPTPPAPPAPIRGETPRVATDLPELPNRTLPRSIHPDGTPAPMPNVPEDEAHHAAAADESTEPLPTPQTRRNLDAKGTDGTPPPAAPPEKVEPPKTESKVIKSSFTLPVLKKIRGLDSLGDLVSSGSSGGLFQGVQFLLPLKPLAIKLPFNQKLEFELIGRVVPDPAAVGQYVVHDDD